MVQPLSNPSPATERNRSFHPGGIGTILAFRMSKGNILATTATGTALSLMTSLKDKHTLQEAITVTTLSGMSLYVGTTLAKPLVNAGTDSLLSYLKSADLDTPTPKLLNFLLEKRQNSKLLKNLITRSGVVGALGSLALLGGYAVASNIYQDVNLRLQGSSIKGPEDYLPEKFDKSRYKQNVDSGLQGDFKITGNYHK